MSRKKTSKKLLRIKNNQNNQNNQNNKNEKPKLDLTDEEKKELLNDPEPFTNIKLDLDIEDLKNFRNTVEMTSPEDISILVDNFVEIQKIPKFEEFNFSNESKKDMVNYKLKKLLLQKQNAMKDQKVEQNIK